MEKASLWIDRKFKSLDEVKKSFLSDKLDQNAKNNVGFYTDFNVTQTLQKDQEILISGQTWVFNKFNYRYLYKFLDQTLDPQENNGYVVALSNNEEVRYFINYFSQNAQVTLQLLLNNYNRTSQVDFKPVYVNDGFLLWLFQKYYKEDSIFQISDGEGTDPSILSIDSILAVKGDTSDQITSIDASGEQISNYISVISFLLESSKLYKMGLRISYGSHKKIEFTIDKPRKTSVISINVANYVGTLDKESNDSKIAKLVIIVNLVIFPKIIQIYQEDTTWNAKSMEDFFKELGKDIRDRTDNLLKDVQEKISVDAMTMGLDI
ncbi:hypothetical protein [Leuconostoc gasicomitatum]|uniref:hypothetical protein n=1 Tax=Leuconostoc gasicomitatum TaxID=115778 RepID=UPI001CC791F3|nr:hypothetical protein [Leuconostoc gasicomitatum]MBZ5946019.1 hypothetical protein [Leuconostoc gasicomitatum]